MEAAFRNIGLIGRSEDDRVLVVVASLVQFLCEKGVNIILEPLLAEKLNVTEHQEARIQTMGEICDLVIVVGGDGSLLGAGRVLAKYGTPVVGINRGQLGFLTDILPQQMALQLNQILAGFFRIESRFLLNCWVNRDDQPIARGVALNDVVLHPSEAVRMIEFELYIEGQFVYALRSDGLIIATPTGSTAYALSGGGPIMHPSLEAICLVPMFPHTLSSRPIVVSANSEIKIVVGTSRGLAPKVSYDGQPGVQLAEGDSIYIVKKSHKLKLLHPLDHDFYEACRSKLGWSSKLT